MKTPHINDRKIGDKFFRIINISDEFYGDKFELQEGIIIEINLKNKQTTVDYVDEILISDEKDINTMDDPLLGNYECVMRIEELTSGLWKMRYDVKDDTKLISMQPYNPK